MTGLSFGLGLGVSFGLGGSVTNYGCDKSISKFGDWGQQSSHGWGSKLDLDLGVGLGWGWGKSSHNHSKWDHHDKGCGDNNSDSNILVGTTNTDGTGSATNLTEENATAVLDGDGKIEYDGLILDHLNLDDGGDKTFASIDEWNKDGHKEISIDNNDDYVEVNNFVDVDINNGGNGSYILVNDAKRGEITTGKGDDEISISVYSNSTHWSNDFYINSGKGDDTISLEDSQNSQYTSFEVEMEQGNDSIDVSGINAPYSDAVSRTVDGGKGFDTITVTDENQVDFENFEVVKANGAQLTVDGDMLADNGSFWHGLVMSDVDLSFDDSVHSIQSNDLSWSDKAYLNCHDFDADNFISVSVETDAGSFDFLTDDLACVA